MHYPKVTAILLDDECAVDACLIDFILFFDICSSLQQICVNSQSHTQTSEKKGGGCEEFLQRGANLKKILILRPKLGV